MTRAEDLAAATEQALHEREITTAALAQIAPVGIMRFDPYGRCNYVNTRWTEMTGRTIDEAIGHGWLDAVHVEDRAAVHERWKRMVKSRQLFREEYRLCNTDGSIRWVFAEGVCLRSYSGETLGFIRAVTDITRHRQLEAELSAAREQLEERVRERTADLQTEIAHRQRLEKQVLEIKEAEQRRFSNDLHDGLGQSLTGILFQVLALERTLEAEQHAMTSRAAKIAELVNQAIGEAHDLVRGITPVPLRPDGLMSALHDLVAELCTSELVACRFECEEPVYIEDNAAATHLYRIAQEAVTNALKHAGASQVTIRLERPGSQGLLSVSDDGRGFSDNHSQGRGLNIMKHRARLAEATFHLRPNEPRGTVIECYFDLP
jgi:PAS domain S-box-containing protein